MINRVLVLMFLFACFAGQAQNEPTIITRDVVYMKDGRVLTGEILIFQESDGDITFKDTEGRKYSITREEYRYFVEDERVNISGKDTLIIHPRKTEEFEFSVGLSTFVSEVNGQVTPDLPQDLGSFSSPWYTPYNLRLSFGKYFDRTHFVGLRLDYALGGMDTYLSPAIRYKYQFDGYKRNLAWYVMAELKYEFMEDEYMGVNLDTSTVDGEIYSNIDYDFQKMTSFGIGISQGVAFILRDKRSIAIELSLFRNNILSSEFLYANELLAFSRWRSSGIGLSLMYNL